MAISQSFIVLCISATNITKMPILLMYGNFFYSTTSGEYSPAEIAIGRFTFETGITKRFHTFINPGNLFRFRYFARRVDLKMLLYSSLWIGRPRIGYAYAAKVHSEQTHGIPVPFSANDGLGEKDLNIVHDRIQDFLCLNGHKFDDGKYLVFAHSDQYSREDDQVAVLKSFMTSMSPKNCLEIDIFPLDRLFDALRTHMINIGRVHGLPNENHVKPIMSCEKFYKDIPGLACDVSIILLKFWTLRAEWCYKQTQFSVASRVRSITFLCINSYFTLGFHIGRTFLRKTWSATCGW